MEFLSSPHRKRRKKNKNQLQRTDTNESFNIFDEISVSDNDLNLNDDKELNNLRNTSMSHIDQKFDRLLTQIYAAPPSIEEDENDNDNQNDFDVNIPPIPSANSVPNEASEQEEEEEEERDEEKDKVHYYMNKAPPKQDKRLKIQMRTSQTFGSIIPLLQERFNQKITLSFEGEMIQNDWTPQYLIDEFDIEEGDLIDANYKPL